MKTPVEEAESEYYCAVAAASLEQQHTEDALTSPEEPVLSEAGEAVAARSLAVVV